MKKTFFALLLAVLAAALPAQALAAGGMDNFASVRVYDGRFEDVAPGDWFYGNVVSLYEMGLTDGQSANRFGEGNQVSLAEAISFAARVHSLYHLGQAEAGPGQYAAPDGPWYAPYVQYLRAAGVLDDSVKEPYTQPATRAQVAHLLSRVLPAGEFDSRNGDTVLTAHNSGRFIPDVTEKTPYREDILALYTRGIVTGSDRRGSFRPDAPITRREMAAMLTRVVDPALRTGLDWDLTPLYSAKGTTYADLIQGKDTYYAVHGLDDFYAIENNLRYMYRNNKTSLKVRIDTGPTGDKGADMLMDNYLDVSLLYPEFTLKEVSYYNDSRGNVSFELVTTEAQRNEMQKAMEKAIEIHDRLWADGTLRLGMNQQKIARVYFDYLIDHCAYDNDYRDVSYTAYGALVNGSATCEGYTAAYNILLKLEGFDCSTALNDDYSHIWTAVTLDGVLYHIDVTWGDGYYTNGESFTDETQFCMTPAVAMSREGL